VDRAFPEPSAQYLYGVFKPLLGDGFAKGHSQLSTLCLPRWWTAERARTAPLRLGRGRSRDGPQGRARTRSEAQSRSALLTHREEDEATTLSAPASGGGLNAKRSCRSKGSYFGTVPRFLKPSLLRVPTHCAA
jgi:hypothetical protein